jgi:hypothetical protein
MRCGVVLISAICTLFLAQSCLAQSNVDDSPPGTVRGTITDSSGSVVVGAIVNLQTAGSGSPRTTITDQVGSFHFSSVEPGSYALTIAALGFTDLETNLSVVAGENPTLPPAVLQVAPARSTVDVGLSPHELAAEQLHEQEKQRLIGIFPNFFVTYQSNAAPLTAAQKFHLGWKAVIDPATFLGAGITAGIEQDRNIYPEYGQGLEGYGKRFGAAYADNVTGVFVGRIVTQAVFHQDPRYFYKGTGGFRARALYAIATAFVCKGDNGRWQPDFSDVIGDLAASEISTLYYPETSRTGLRLFHNVLLGFGGRALDHLLQEFVYDKVTTHIHKTTAHSQPVLPEGTPVSLISVEDLRSDTPGETRAINLVLARGIEVDGVIVAEAGSRAIAQATYSSLPSSAADCGEAIHLSLENVYLKVGERNVPLRSTGQKSAVDALDYHWLEDTGRITLVLYLAENVTLPPAQ